MDLQSIARTIISGGRQFGQNVQRDVRQVSQDPQAFQQKQSAYLNQMDPMMIAGLTGPVAPARKVAQSITQRVPISKLVFNQDDFQRAMGDVLEGRYSQTPFPPLAVRGGHKGFDVKDGLHRIAREILDGGKDTDIITDEAAYRKLSELSEQGQKSPIISRISQYLKDDRGRFAGSRKK